MSDFYGDNINRFWFGMVKYHADDLHLGRVKVKIIGIHDEIADKDLPWAQVLLPSTEPGVNGLGQNPMIRTGAQVFGVFIDGKDSQLPLVLGSIPRIASPPELRDYAGGGDITNGSNYNTAAGNPASRNSPVTDGVTVDRNIPGSANQEKAFLYLRDKANLTSDQAAGIVGNLMLESGTSINPWAYNSAGGGYGARGIAQWRGERWLNMVDLANKSNINTVPTPSDYRNKGWPAYYPLEFQLAFIIWEFENYSMGKRTYAKLKTATTADEAAEVFYTYYEVNFEATATRKKYARNIKERYG